MLFISNPDGEDPRFYSIDVYDTQLMCEYAVKPVDCTTLIYEDKTYTIEYMCLTSMEHQEDLDQFSHYIHAYKDPINNFGEFFTSRGFGGYAGMRVIATDPDGVRKLFIVESKSERYAKGCNASVNIRLADKSKIVAYSTFGDNAEIKSMIKLTTYLSTLKTFEQVVLFAMLLKATTVTEYKPEGIIITPVKDLINQNIIDYLNSDKFMQTWEV